MCVVLPQDRQYESESHILRRGLIKTIAKKNPGWHRCLSKPNAKLCIEDTPHPAFLLTQSQKVALRLAVRSISECAELAKK